MSTAGSQFGLEKYAKCREWNVPLTALTEWGAENDRKPSRQAGLGHHLIKPAEHSMIGYLLRHLARRNKQALPY